MIVLIVSGVLAILLGARSGSGLMGLGFALLLLAAVLLLLDYSGACSSLVGADYIRACG